VASCIQCGKTAIVSVGGNPLCVDCYLKLVQAIQIQYDVHAREANYLMDEMEAAVGLYGLLPSPRFEVYQPMVHQGPLTFHNIKVDQSVVGSINTGEVQRIDVAMDRIKISGNEELVKILKKFTEAVITETKLDAELKNHIIEQNFISCLSICFAKRKTKVWYCKSCIIGR
jgi:hypothetical protein